MLILLSVSQKLLPSVGVACPGRGVWCSQEGSADSPCSPQCARSGWKGSASSRSPQDTRQDWRPPPLQSQSAHCSEGKALENYCHGSCWFLLMSPFNLENRACSFLIFVVNLILMRKVHSWFDFNEENGLQYMKPICSILTVLLSITYSDSDPYFRHFLICKNMTLYMDKGFFAENRNFRAKFCNALCLWIILTYVYSPAELNPAMGCSQE